MVFAFVLKSGITVLDVRYPSQKFIRSNPYNEPLYNVSFMA